MRSTDKNLNVSLNGLDSLSEFLTQESTQRRGRGIPPLEQWHPKNIGEIDIVIKSNGEWWHEGSKITRQSLIDLFATVLWCEDNNNSRKYYLKTPVQKIQITVEDAPFFINDVNVVENDKNYHLEFVSSTGDVIVLDDEHKLLMKNYQGQDRPYITVRFGMLGLISRNVFMHLVKIGELIQTEDQTVLKLQSGASQYQLSVPSDSV